MCCRDVRQPPQGTSAAWSRETAWDVPDAGGDQGAAGLREHPAGWEGQA